MDTGDALVAGPVRGMRESEIRASFLRNTGRDALGRRQECHPRLGGTRCGLHSDAVRIFNEYVYPIVNVYVNPDGSAAIEP